MLNFMKKYLILLVYFLSCSAKALGPMDSVCERSGGCLSAEPLLGFALLAIGFLAIAFGWLLGRHSIKLIYGPAAFGGIIIFLLKDFHQITFKTIFILSVGGLILGWILIFIIQATGIYTYIKMDDKKSCAEDDEWSRSPTNNIGNSEQISSPKIHEKDDVPEHAEFREYKVENPSEPEHLHSIPQAQQTLTEMRPPRAIFDSHGDLSSPQDSQKIGNQLKPKLARVGGKYLVNLNKPANPKWLKDVFPPNTQESPAQSEDAESPVRAMVVSPVAIQKRMEFLASLDENGNLHPDLNQEGERAAKVEKLKATLEQHKQAKGNRPTRAIVEPRGSLVPFKLNTKSEDES